MNKRIRLLAEQATEYANEQNELHGVGYVITFKEKFAQLIVAECIECADTVGKNNLVSGYPNSTAHHVKQKIKQHFGVEE